MLRILNNSSQKVGVLMGDFRGFDYPNDAQMAKTLWVEVLAFSKVSYYVELIVKTTQLLFMM